MLHSLVNVLNDALLHPSKLVSPSLFFVVLSEYAQLGAGWGPLHFQVHFPDQFPVHFPFDTN